MGKNRDREYLIRVMVNTLVHEIIFKHTHKPESKNFLASEIIGYAGQTEKIAKQHTWNNNDKKYIKESSLKKIKEKLAFKYPDIKYNPKEPEILLERKIKELLEK